MTRRTVSSSNLASVGYDESSRTLEVEFRSGAVYQYAQVPRTAWRALMTAPSIGSYFNREIRTQYAGSKVE
jgi:hypothetical protein